MSRVVLDIEGFGEARVEAVRRLPDGRLKLAVNDAPVASTRGAGVRAVRVGAETHVEIDGEVWLVRVRSEIDGASRGAMGEQGVVAPMNGEIVSVAATVGDIVEAGAELLVLESMKLHMSLPTPRPGRVSEILVAPGQVVAKGEVLVRVADVDSEEGPSAAD